MSVIFAVVFLLVVSMLLASVLSYAFSASRSVAVYERDRALHYAADSALEVAVQMAEDHADLGIAGTTAADCAMTLPLAGGAATASNDTHDPGQVFSGTARLNVTCVPATATSGQVTGGVQQTREVTFTVECRIPASASVSQSPLNCGSAFPQVIVLGRARVRYDIDPGYPAADQRARVPKILEWDLER